MKKKGFTLVEMIAVVMIIAIIAVLAVPPVLQAIRGAKNDISDAMKKVIVSASDLYMDADKDNYVRYNGNRYCITLRELVESEKLNNPIYDPTTSQEVSQDKFVQVDIFDNEYSYEIVDECEEIRKHSLVYQLKQQYKEDNTSGLLKDDDGSYYYKGTNEEVSNNFVWFGGHLWRVLSINNDDTLTMITQQPLTSISPAYSAWTTKEGYEASYINHWLNDEIDGVFYKSLAQADKDKIQDNTYNVGIYTNVSEITTIQKIGLLDEMQYTKAGGQDSFLDIKDLFWLSNRQENAYIRGVSEVGSPYQYYLHENILGVRPVIRTVDLIITEGKGTLIDPYREESTITKIDNVKIGEYISVPTNGTDCGEDNRCLFRVVSKDNNSIKVILNGLSLYRTNFNSNSFEGSYTSDGVIDTKLKSFLNKIDSKYRYAENDKIFGIGAYTGGMSYTVAQDTKHLGNIGLPVVGEMFSGNDIDVTNETKTFVNNSTIENPAVAEGFWIMNARSGTQTNHIYYNGTLFANNPACVYGIRPVLFLKNNLKFTGGEGTAENPFTLE